MEIIVHVNPENLIDGWPQEDIDALDWDATAQKFVDLYHAAIKDQYPDATVRVYGDSNYQTRVWTSLEDLAEDENITAIEADVFGSGDWAVSREPSA